VIELEVVYDAPASAVWAVLTDRTLAADWWLATDLVPEAGRVFRAIPPDDLPGFHGPFNIEVVAVDVERRLAMRWYGKELYSDVIWDLEPTRHGSRLRITQSGYFGVEGLPHRRELLAAYQTFFADRLPRLLAREPAPTAVHHPARIRALSAVAGVVLAAVVIVGLSTLILQPSTIPAEARASPPRYPAVASLPGTTESATGLPSPQASVPSSPRPRTTTAAPTAPLSALFRVRESYELGYIGAITIRAGAQPVDGWRAVITLPPGATVSSAWDQMSVRQDGTTVTFEPLAAHRVIGANDVFTFEYQVNLPDGASERPVTCAVNGVPCG